MVGTRPRTVGRGRPGLVAGGALATLAAVVWFGFLSGVPDAEDVDDGDAEPA